MTKPNWLSTLVKQQLNKVLSKNEQTWYSKHTRLATTRVWKVSFGVSATSQFSPFPAAPFFPHNALKLPKHPEPQGSSQPPEEQCLAPSVLPCSVLWQPNIRGVNCPRSSLLTYTAEGRQASAWSSKTSGKGASATNVGSWRAQWRAGTQGNIFLLLCAQV